MKNIVLFIGVLAQFFILNSCEQSEEVGKKIIEEEEEETEQNPNKEFRFIDEFVIPDGETFENTMVGGLSGIDYANGTWVAISDDPIKPRFYELEINYSLDGFSGITIKSVTELKDKGVTLFEQGTVDSEAIRLTNDGLVWSSEGNIDNGIDPFVRTANINGDFTAEVTLSNRYMASIDVNKGPRQNGVFEGLAISVDGKGYWVNTELPLKDDGLPSTSELADSPIRIAYINKATGNFEKEFAYQLDKVARPSIGAFSFELNGVVELLEYETDKFYVLERSFSAGYIDGGHDVKIYDVDFTNATDVSTFASLENADYVAVSKKLIFDFETVRGQLTRGVVDNIEGITFGPNFSNGNKSIVVVSDNNFSSLFPQLNQFIVLEVQE